MITYSIIKKSELEGALRLDAEYYQPEYLNINSKIKNQKSKLLKDFAEKIFSGPFGSTLKSESYQTLGIPFIRIGDIADIFVEKESLVYISPEENKRIFSTHLNIGDIVFSKIGTIGRLSIIDEELGQVNISENNIGIRFKNIDSEMKIFLLFFLISKYGQSQITRMGSGNIQQKLNVSDIESIAVPLFSKELLQNLSGDYKNIIKFRKESEVFYSQAEQLLLKELGLENFEEQEDLVSIVKFSDIKKFQRMDAEYFQPKYEKIISRIKQTKHSLLGDLVSVKKGIEIGAEQYQENGKLFFRVSSLSKQGIIDKDQKYLSDELYQKLKANFEPKIGEILLTKDATPGIAYVLKEKVDGVISSGTLRLKIKQEIEAEYLALFINSILGQMQAERDAGGSIISHWKPEQVKNLIVPILPQEVQQKIAELVIKSHQARQKAKELLEEAKQKVENLIEK